MKNRMRARIVWAGLAIIIAVVGGLVATQNSNPGINVENFFSPSGYMGDGEYERKYIEFSGAHDVFPNSQPTCIKVSYSFGPQRWAGVYWLNEPDNWGDKAGNNYSGRGLSKVIFWAKGEHGTEVIEFKTGGIDSPKKKYRDSFKGTTGRLTLSTVWKPYEIDLRGSNLSNVIGGFCWVASADYNSGNRVTFYLDDIRFE